MQPTIRQIFNNSYSSSQRITYLYRFFKWQLISKVFRGTMVFKFTSNSKLMLMNGFQALTGNYYFGINDPDIMPFVVHLLRPDDLFVDVGANGGAYTILAAGEKRANTISIEAASDIFTGLLKNITLNNLEDRVEAWNVAASDKEGMVPFTTSDHATNHISYEQRSDIVEIEAKTLDHILNGRVPILMKMDIEGHEHNALLGANNIISSPDCKAIVIEFSNAGEYYGYGNVKTHQLLTDYGFKPYKYNYKTKQLTSFNPLNTYFEFNMIYVKDENFVKSRLVSANRVIMSGQIV